MDEEEKRLILSIIENMLQSARLKQMGFYTSDDREAIVILGEHDADAMSELFIDQARADAVDLLRIYTRNIEIGFAKG